MKKRIGVILALLIVVVAGIFISIKVLQKNNTNSKVEDNQQVVKDFDLNEAEKLREQFGINWEQFQRLSYDDSEETSFENYKKAQIVWYLEEHGQHNKKINCEQIKNYFSSSNVEDIAESDVCAGNDDEITIIPYEEANQRYQYLYGKDKTLEKKDFMFLCLWGYVYIEEENGFAAIEMQCGTGVFGVDYIEKVTSAKVNGDMLTIDLILDEGVFRDEDEQGNEIYRLGKNHDITWPSTKKIEEIHEEVIKKYKDKLDKCQMILKEEDGHYVLQKVLINNLEAK